MIYLNYYLFCSKFSEFKILFSLICPESAVLFILKAVVMHVWYQTLNSVQFLTIYLWCSSEVKNILYVCVDSNHVFFYTLMLHNNVLLWVFDACLLIIYSFMYLLLVT